MVYKELLHDKNHINERKSYNFVVDIVVKLFENFPSNSTNSEKKSFRLNNTDILSVSTVSFQCYKLLISTWVEIMNVSSIRETVDKLEILFISLLLTWKVTLPSFQTSVSK